MGGKKTTWSKKREEYNVRLKKLENSEKIGTKLKRTFTTGVSTTNKQRLILVEEVKKEKRKKKRLWYV